MSEIKNILIDDRSGFWTESDTWAKAFPEDESVRIGNFLARDKPVDELSKRISAEGFSLDEIKWTEVCIVSDAYLSGSNLDGANLLKALYDVRKKWNRAVIYSIEPELNEFCKNLGHTTVRPVIKTGNRDAPKIKAFLESGVFPTLHPIWSLRRFLTPLAFCLDILLANINVLDEGMIFQKMQAYGIPEFKTVEGTYPFRPLHSQVLDENHHLFSGKTAAYFLTESKSEFLDLSTFSSGLGQEQTGIEPEQQWIELLRALHPYESLDPSIDLDMGKYPAQPLRLLWELIQTGGDLQLLLLQATDALNSLKACERAWVRRRLTILGEHFQMIKNDKEALRNLIRQCHRVLVRIENYRDAVVKAELQISSGTL